MRVIARLDARHGRPSTRAAIYLKLDARWHGLGGRIRSGEYGIDARQNLISAVALFMSGSTIVHELRIVEGWSFMQALQTIRANAMIKQTLADATPEQIMKIGRASCRERVCKYV